MRFETTRALDAIERRLATDPLLAGAVVDLAEVVRLADLDGGRPATLMRLGLLVDALSRHLGDGSVALYAVAERGLLSDTDLTSNERMVLRRWSDDGLVEIIPAGAPALARAGEVAALTGLPVVTRAALSGHPGPVYAPVPESGGAALKAAPGGGALARPHPVTGRFWHCPEPHCPSFGGAGPSLHQPPPALPSGAPVCPRHGERLADAGARPWTVPFAVRTGGLTRTRFLVSTGHPIGVGRAPEDGIELATYIDEAMGRWVSRTHLVVEARDGVVLATDMSTNGSAVLARTGAAAPARRVPLTRGQPYVLGEWDEVELHAGLTIGRADRPPASPPSAGEPDSVMGDAPTIAMRLPPPPR